MSEKKKYGTPRHPPTETLEEWLTYKWNMASASLAQDLVAEVLELRTQLAALQKRDADDGIRYE